MGEIGRGEGVADAGGVLGASAEEEGDVGSELGADVVERFRRSGEFGEDLGGGEENCGGVGAASAHACAGWDALFDVDVGVGELGGDGFREGGDGADGEIFLVGRDLGIGCGAGDPGTGGVFRESDGVVEVER